MKLRTLAFPLVAAVGLAVGSTGSASAAGHLTRHEVKKISAKVVEQLAPTLSVAHAESAHNADFATNSTNATNANHATTATDADTVGGLTPAALQSRATRYDLTAVDHQLQWYWTLAAAPGTYLASYNVEAQMSGDTNYLTCDLLDAAGQPGQALAYGFNAPNHSSTASSSALITVTSDSKTYLYCNSGNGGNFSVDAGSRSSVTLVPIDIATTTTAPNTPSGSASRAGTTSHHH